MDGQVAEQYCRFHAAASVLEVWLQNGGELCPALEGGHWVVLALMDLFPTRPAKRGGRESESLWRRGFDCMNEQLDREQMFSLLPFGLAPAAEEDWWA